MVAAFGANNVDAARLDADGDRAGSRRRRTDLGRGRARPRRGGAARARTAAAPRARSVGRRLVDVGCPHQSGRLGRRIPRAIRLRARRTADVRGVDGPRARGRSPAGARPCSTRCCTTAKDAWENTFRIVLPDGTVAWIQSLGRADRDADGQVTRLTGLELDVTERRAGRGGAAGAPRRGTRSRAADAARDRHAGHRVGGRAGR